MELTAEVRAWSTHQTFIYKNLLDYFAVFCYKALATHFSRFLPIPACFITSHERTPFLNKIFPLLPPQRYMLATYTVVVVMAMPRVVHTPMTLQRLCARVRKDTQAMAGSVQVAHSSCLCYLYRPGCVLNTLFLKEPFIFFTREEGVGFSGRPLI